MKIRLLTVAWGREFTDLFLRLTLRSLLAEGNIPALARAHQVVYSIYTTREDAQILETHPTFLCLRGIVEVRISLFTEDEIDCDNYGSHGILWERAIDLARRNRQTLFFIMPDLLYEQGTLVRWARRFENGTRALFTLGPQVVLETILPELEKNFPEGPIAIGNEQLLDLLYRHFHPLHASMRHDSPRRPPHPEYDLRLVADQAMIIRQIVSHPFCINPGYFNCIHHYAPQDHLHALAFEPCSVLSVEPLLKRLDGYYRPWPLDEIRLSNMGGWWNAFTTLSCECESAVPYEIRWPVDAREISDIERKRAIAGGQFYRFQMISTGRLFDLFVGLRNHGLKKAAALVAMTTFAARLRRRATLRGGATLLVPLDDAVARDWPEIAELLKPGREGALLNLLRDHILLCDNQTTARSLPIEPLLSGVNAAAPFHIGPFTIYPVDHVLWRERKQAMLRDKKEWIPPKRPRTFTVTRWARQSRLRLLAYYLLHVPFLEPIIAILLVFYLLLTSPRRLAGWLRPPLHNALYRLSAKLDRIPIIGKFFRLSVQLLRSLMLDGPVVTWERIARRLVRRSVDSKIRIPADATRKLQPPTDLHRDADVPGEIRSIRALQAVAQVLSDFCSKATSKNMLQSVPLAFAQRKINEVSPDEQQLSETLEASLRRLTDKYPSWAEAWLELAFLHQDSAHHDLAFACFDRAMRGHRYTDAAKRSVSPQAVAAANHGRYLAARGKYSEACESFAICLNHEPEFNIVAVEYANALRQLGKVDLSLLYYTQGMFYQESRWNLPMPPRNANALRFPHLALQRAEARPAPVHSLNASAPAAAK